MYRFCWRDPVGITHRCLYVWTLRQVKAQIVEWEADSPMNEYRYERKEG